LRRRQAGGFAGPNPIGWQDIEAFSRQSGLRLAPWELGLIEAIDDIYLASAIKKPPLPTSTARDIAETVSMDDTKAVKSLLRSIGRRRDGKKGW
jgi:hypothetical protein